MHKMWNRLYGSILSWFKEDPKEKVLQEQGFTVSCPHCQVLLNDTQPAVPVSDGIYQWECRLCGRQSRFLLDCLVPLRVH